MTPPLAFGKELLADERYEAAAVFDVDNDGVLDIVCGAYWYRGPDFRQRRYRGPVQEYGEYYDDFFALPIDVDGDGFLDVVSGGYFGERLRWHRNPSGDDPEAMWEMHEIARIGPIETARAWDVDGDGVLEIVPNTPSGPQRVFKLDTDERGRGVGTFTEHIVWDGGNQGSGHGLGCGDIAGHGRHDLVLSHGWLEAPADPYRDVWRYHGGLELGTASVPIIVADIDGDGRSELIAGNAHGYGLDWYERIGAAADATWRRHPIDPYCSQYHDMIWADIDGDGDPELITGTRYRAHNGHDPGEYNPLGIYYFKWTGEGFAKEVVDFGPVGAGAGCGIAFAVADLDDDGLPEIVAPGKDGLHLFRNLGFANGRGDRPHRLVVTDVDETCARLADGGAEIVTAAPAPFGEVEARFAYVRLPGPDGVLLELSRAAAETEER